MMWLWLSSMASTLISALGMAVGTYRVSTRCPIRATTRTDKRTKLSEALRLQLRPVCIDPTQHRPENQV
ncbi:hypothetical protein BJX65DRAFT_274441 [Aspergillus insuetus]